MLSYHSINAHSRNKNLSSSLSLPRSRSFAPISSNKNFLSNYDMHSSINTAKNLIQNRLNKLHHKKHLLKSASCSSLLHSNDMCSLYNYSTLSHRHYQTNQQPCMRQFYPIEQNPRMYSYHFVSPVYQPLDIPLAGEPISYPRVELGFPVGGNDAMYSNNYISNGGSNTCSRCNGTGNGNVNGFGVHDIVTLLSALGKFNPISEQLPNISRQQMQLQQPQQQPPQIIKIIEREVHKRTPSPTPTPPKQPKISIRKIQITPTPTSTPTPTPPSKHSRKSTSSFKQPVPVVIDKITPRNNNNNKSNYVSKRQWWNLAISFIHIYTFFSFSLKYSRQAKTRNNIISQRTKEIIIDISKIKEWVIHIEQSFWDEFKIFEDLNVSFKNIDTKIKIQEKSQIIIAMIKKYIENLITNTSKLSLIPNEIQKLLYKYTRDKNYFPKKYLTSFQVNRLEFNVYGAIQNVTDAQAGMILAYLIICGVSVQQILLHMKDVFPEFKHYPYINITGKYIGSILHYLTRDTFAKEPEMTKELLLLLNYYRNYHLYNEQVERKRDEFRNNEIDIKDIDEFEESLIPEDSITLFWDLNKAFINTFKDYIYAWGVRLSGIIKRKYKLDDNRKGIKKQKINRPKDKKVEYQLVDD